MEAPTPLSPRPQDEGEEKVWTLEELNAALDEFYTELGYLPVPDGIDPKVWFEAVREARLKWERKAIFGDE